MTASSDFSPDWVSPPGETILDMLDERNVSFSDFARGLGKSAAETRRILSGEKAITGRIATRLEGLLGGTSEFWLSRESQYRESVATHARKELDAWARKFPIKEMIDFGWLPSKKTMGEKAQECLRFFGVSSLDDWRLQTAAAFRTSPTFESKPEAVAAWLRRGEVEGDALSCKSWNAEKLRAELPHLRALTRKRRPEDFLPDLIRRCSDCGVAVTIVRAPTGCRASGATKFLTERKALLMLSFRYRTDDHFWFSFFHEIGHLLLHAKDAVFLEGSGRITSTEEEEADAFAQEILIPAAEFDSLRELPLERKAIRKFALQLGISPGIVVGQMQHHKLIDHSQHNALKARYEWTARDVE